MRGALRGMEWGSKRERPQRTGQGNPNQTDDRRTGLEGSWHRGQYQAGVTEHSDGGGRAGGLETALWALQKGNVDVGFLQETKLTQGIHTQNSVGYNDLATDAESWHRGGGVAVVWRAVK